MPCEPLNEYEVLQIARNQLMAGYHAITTDDEADDKINSMTNVELFLLIVSAIDEAYRAT